MINNRSVIRIRPLIGAVLLASALAGCAPAMAPMQVPSSHGQLKLCTGTPALPPNNLASNPNYREFSIDVIDSTGAPTMGLTQADFVAAENDRPVPIAYFHAEQGRPPVSVGILVDKSGSMVTKLPMVSASVGALMPKLDACDEVMIYAFGIEPILVQNFTTDHALAGERLKLVGAWGQTPFYDGVQQGIGLLNNSHYPDRVAIIFTDDIKPLIGSSLDNASKSATRDDIVSLALNSQNRFFLIGVGQPKESRGFGIGVGPFMLGKSVVNAMDPEDLGKFATDLGGEFFLVAGEPDDNAPKVIARPRNTSASTGLFTPILKYAPLAADPGEIQQFATSAASQIDRHYTIGLISSGQPASATHISITVAKRPSARTTVHEIKLTSPTP